MGGRHLSHSVQMSTTGTLCRRNLTGTSLPVRTPWRGASPSTLGQFGGGKRSELCGPTISVIATNCLWCISYHHKHHYPPFPVPSQPPSHLPPSPPTHHTVLPTSYTHTHTGGCRVGQAAGRHSQGTTRRACPFRQGAIYLRRLRALRCEGSAG